MNVHHGVISTPTKQRQKTPREYVQRAEQKQ